MMAILILNSSDHIVFFLKSKQQQAKNNQFYMIGVKTQWEDLDNNVTDRIIIH